MYACVSFLYRYNPLCPELVLECYHTVSMLLQYVWELDVCCVFVYYCIHLEVCKWVTLDMTLSFTCHFIMTFYLSVCMLAVGVSLLLHCCGSEKVQGMSLLTTVQEQHKGIPTSVMSSHSSRKF